MDNDWTEIGEKRDKSPDTWRRIYARRAVRDALAREKLENWISIKHRSSGGCLWPRIHSGDECTYDPVTKDGDVEVNDIVFCQPQPKDRYFCHLVKSKTKIYQRKDTADPAYVYWIVNGKGFENGWCHIYHIYGRMIHSKR